MEGKIFLLNFFLMGFLSLLVVIYFFLFFFVFFVNSSIQDDSDFKLIEFIKIKKNLVNVTVGKNLEKMNIW